MGTNMKGGTDADRIQISAGLQDHLRDRYRLFVSSFTVPSGSVPWWPSGLLLFTLTSLVLYGGAFDFCRRCSAEYLFFLMFVSTLLIYFMADLVFCSENWMTFCPHGTSLSIPFYTVASIITAASFTSSPLYGAIGFTTGKRRSPWYV